MKTTNKVVLFQCELVYFPYGTRFVYFTTKAKCKTFKDTVTNPVTETYCNYIGKIVLDMDKEEDFTYYHSRIIDPCPEKFM